MSPFKNKMLKNNEKTPFPVHTLIICMGRYIPPSRCLGALKLSMYFQCSAKENRNRSLVFDSPRTQINLPEIE